MGLRREIAELEDPAITELPKLIMALLGTSTFFPGYWLNMVKLFGLRNGGRKTNFPFITLIDA